LDANPETHEHWVFTTLSRHTSVTCGLQRTLHERGRQGGPDSLSSSTGPDARALPALRRPNERATSHLLRAAPFLHRRRPWSPRCSAQASAQLPSRDGALAAKEDPIKSRTIRHHRPWL